MIKKFFIYIILLLLIVTCSKDDNISPGEDTITIDSLKINRKVLVVGIDGFRSDAMQENITPFIHNLSQTSNSYYTDKHIVESITYSGPNWSSILTGVHMDKHNVTDNSFDNSNYNEYPSFFHYIEKANSEINTASIVNWTPINAYTLSADPDFAPTNSTNDFEVFEYAKNILSNSSEIEADVLFLQLDELDGTGHTYGFSPEVEEYTNYANILDSYSEELFNIIKNRRANGEDWMYFIVSDHGGEGTAHGDSSDPNINQTIFLAQHPELIFKANCCYTSSQADIAPTILNFLGISSSEFENNTDGLSVLE
jgi:hypothetical protein